MQSAIVRVALGEQESDPYRILYRTRQHLDQLTREGGIPTLEKALDIIRGILRNEYPNDISRDIITYVLRIHLLSLARKEKLNTMLFQGRQLSTQEICSSLYDSARKFSSIRRKLKKIDYCLKPKTMQALIDAVAAANGRSIQSDPPLTIRRGPVHRRPKVTIGYA